MPFFLFILSPNSPFLGGGLTSMPVINGWYGFAVAIGLLFGALTLGLVLMSAWCPRPTIKLLRTCSAGISIALVAIPAASLFPILYSLVLASLVGVVVLQARATQASE